MARPPDYEWAVLDESQDPIPGDPYEVRAESTRLSKMAGTIHDQINMLKDIAGDENVGHFADKLRDKANELTGDLAKVATRYDQVSGCLKNWADDLEYCQSESLKALAKAQQAAPTANAPEIKPGPGSPPPTPQQQQQAQAAERVKSAAQGELNDAKQQLADAKNHRDDRGNYWKNKIESADHDSLKDSWWDGFKDFVHEHAGLIKLLADVCTWIVTGLLILSLFIPGLDLATGPLLALVLGTMGAALLGHTALALSGDGSWIDVGLDVVAIATFGGGLWAKAALDGTVTTAEGLSKALQGGEGLTGGLGSTEKAMAEVVDVAKGGGRSLAARTAQLGKILGGGAKDFLTGNEAEISENLAKLGKVTGAAGDSSFFQSLALNGKIFAGSARGLNVVGTLADEFGHWAGGSDTINFVGNLFSGKAFEAGTWNVNVEGTTSPSLPPFTHLKEVTTHEIGS